MLLRAFQEKLWEKEEDIDLEFQQWLWQKNTTTIMRSIETTVSFKKTLHILRMINNSLDSISDYAKPLLTSTKSSIVDN